MVPPAAPPRRRRLRAAVFGGLAALFVLEFALRAMTEEKERGRTEIAGVVLLPCVRPRFEEAPFAQGGRYLGYDAACGWSPRPLAESADGLYAADQHGLRAPAAAPREIPAAAPRVMLCGDSFAHSDDVPWEGSLAAHLERALPGTAVLNAGVPAFGTDQSYLRWKDLAARGVRADVVVIGVHPSDFERNVRVFPGGGRFGGTLPFSKPRFVLDGDGLRLVNAPPMRGQAIRDVLATYDASDLRRHDFFHRDGQYERSAGDALRTMRFLRSFLAQREYERRHLSREDPSGEIQAVTRRIVADFAREVRASGAAPLVVTFPATWQLEQWRAGNAWWEGALRGACSPAGCELLDLAPVLCAEMDRTGRDLRAPFTAGGVGHYTAETNEFLASVLAGAVGRARSSR